MGWDCSFHLVDPTHIKKIIGALAAKKPAPAEVLAAYEDGAALWAEAVRRVFEDPPERAVRVACAMAIKASAALYPHHDERGVALSFGPMPEPPRRSGVRVPSQLTAPVEPLLAALVKKRPELAGLAPTMFESNGDTGVFVPAAQARKAADFVWAAAYQYDRQEQARFVGLWNTLTAAARYGLAYWEATDIYVAPSPSKGREAIAPPFERFEYLSPEGAKYVGLEVVDDVVVGRWHNVPYGLDTRIPDATFTRFDTRDVGIGRLADGRWVEASGDALRMRAATEAGVPGAVVHDFTIDAWTSLMSVCTGPDDALIVPVILGAKTAPSLPSYWDGSSIRLVTGLPKETTRPATSLGAVRLGDGTHILVWNGDAYEIKDGAVVGEPWRSAITNPLWASRHHVPWGLDGFYYVDAGALRRIRRGHPPEHVAKLSDLVERLTPGPDGAVIALHKRHSKKRTLSRLATIFFPDAHEEIPLSTVDVGFLGSLSFAGGSFWGHTGPRDSPLAFSTEKRVFRADPDVLMAMKRTASR